MKIKMMSVNQMTIYHTVMEVFHILFNYSSEQVNNKYITAKRKIIINYKMENLRAVRIFALNLRV